MLLAFQTCWLHRQLQTYIICFDNYKKKTGQQEGTGGGTDLGFPYHTRGGLRWLNSSWGRKRSHCSVSRGAHDLVLTVQPVMTQLRHPSIKNILRFDLRGEKIGSSESPNDLLAIVKKTALQSLVPSSGKYVPRCQGQSDGPVSLWTSQRGPHQYCREVSLFVSEAGNVTKMCC